MEERVLPNHIAIILDGNGRWAKKRGMPRTFGHAAGADNLDKLARYCNKIGLKHLTVYAFSTENWSRPQKEVDYLMKLLEKWFIKILKNLDNIKIRVIGEKDNLSDKLKKIIKDIEDATKDFTGLELNIAFNYGSRDEIIHSVKEMIELGEDITKENLQKHLYATEDVDLLIRTSGEQRISNFLLWQISYSELYFTDTYFPDFNEKELEKALDAYFKRDRRYGGLKEEKK